MDFPNIRYHGPVVIFDLDDTLFRERDFCRSGFRFLETVISEMLGQTIPNIAPAMEKALCHRENYFDVLEDLVHPLFLENGKPWNLQELIVLYREHVPEKLDLSEGIAEIIDNLNRNEVQMGIITDGRSVTQRSKIKALGIERYFPPENIIISEEFGADKSTTEPFVAFVRNYPEASRFYYIGDNPTKDFINPNLLGWTTVLAPQDPDNVHPLEFPDDTLFHPSHRISSWAELLPLVRS